MFIGETRFLMVSCNFPLCTLLLLLLLDVGRCSTEKHLIPGWVLLEFLLFQLDGVSLLGAGNYGNCLGGHLQHFPTAIRRIGSHGFEWSHIRRGTIRVFILTAMRKQAWLSTKLYKMRQSKCQEGAAQYLATCIYHVCPSLNLSRLERQNAGEETSASSCPSSKTINTQGCLKFSPAATHLGHVQY